MTLLNLLTATVAAVESVAAAAYYTCSGNVRGDCGVKHRTIEAAARCCRRDSVGCHRQGGYSDRFPEGRDPRGRAVPLDDWDRDAVNEILRS